MVDDKAHQPLSKVTPSTWTGWGSAEASPGWGCWAYSTPWGGGAAPSPPTSLPLFICRFGLFVCLLLSTYLCCLPPNPPPAFYLQVWSLCLSSSIYLSMLLSICLSAFDNATMVDDKAHQPLSKVTPSTWTGWGSAEASPGWGCWAYSTSWGGGAAPSPPTSLPLFICRFGLFVCLLLSTYLCCLPPNPPPAFYLQVWSLCLSSSIYLSMLLSICLSAFDNATMVDDKAHQPLSKVTPSTWTGWGSAEASPRWGCWAYSTSWGGGAAPSPPTPLPLFLCRFGLSVCLLSTYLCCYVGLLTISFSLSICLSVYLLFSCMFVFMFVSKSFSMYLRIYLSIYLSIYIYLSIFLSIYLSIYVTIYLYFFLTRKTDGKHGKF